MSPKIRLDLLLVEKDLALSRQQAQALIMSGKVLVDTLRVDKPGSRIDKLANITIKGPAIPYVSRGGLKLEAALKQSGLSVTDKTCMDVGASTGGFTDCLLQHGAARVYAVDVGYGQLAWKLRQDQRVVPIERTNIRHMPADHIPEKVDLVTIDASFISLKLVVPAVIKFMKPAAEMLALIKPQFEAGKGNVGKGGVVKSTEIHRNIIVALTQFFGTQNLKCGPVIPSPVLGPKGNQEYIMLLSRADSVL